VGTPQVSGKVFRFLSAMHPALSKSERKRYAGYDPDKWYDWTPEVSSEFTELMRRTPRDTSFARGFAYVAQRGIPEGHYIPTGKLFEYLAGLPSAYRGPEGSGFEATVEKAGKAKVTYTGMPGFSNVCIAIQGELTQRLQASGAHGVVVRHGDSCRVSGGALCEFEVEWSGESAPADAQAADPASLVDPGFKPGDAASIRARLHAVAAGVKQPEDDTPAEAPAATQEAAEKPQPEEPAAAAAAASKTPEPPPAAPRAKSTPQPAPGAPVARAASAPSAGGGMATAEAGENGAGISLGADLAGLESGSDDLFTQLRKRLADADRQSRLYADAQAQIDSLRLELGRVRATAEAEVAKAEKEKNEAIEALGELKRRVRSVIADD